MRIADPPFSKLDLISCRNLLIYLESNLQDKVLRLFHFALKPNSFLLLGSSESLGARQREFRTLSKKWRIFQPEGPSPLGLMEVPMSREAGSSIPRFLAQGLGRREPNLADIARQALVETFAPASVLVTRRHQVLYVYGDTSDYLSQPQPEAAIVHQLEDELRTTREELQSTIEELETSNEELKASNEEVMSMNEELQSSNEELETSKEELQSLNEELTTVNHQLQNKIVEVESTNNDLSNLLASSNIATLFLDRELRIKRFTPATTRLMNLIPADVGRPVADIANRYANNTLKQDCLDVLDDLRPVERELLSQDGDWYIRRVQPYRTRDNRSPVGTPEPRRPSAIVQTR